MELAQLSFLVILLVSSPPETFVDNVLLRFKINIINVARIIGRPRRNPSQCIFIILHVIQCRPEEFLSIIMFQIRAHLFAVYKKP